MTESKQEELQSLPENSEGEIEGGAGEGSPSNKPETAEETIIRLEKEVKKGKDFENAFYKSKEKIRELSDQLASKPNDEIPPDPYDEDARVKSLVQQELAEERKKQREQNLKVARDKFFKKFPQYAPQNDPNDYNYGRLREKTNKMVLGDTVDEIYENLVFVHNGLNQKPNDPDPTPKVEESGIGDTSVPIKSTEKKPSYMTRPLTEVEKRAASCFPGGETAWRKKRAELDGEKVS